MRKQQSLYEINRSTNPPSCLPVGIDTSNFIDVTRIGDGWRRFIDTRTGRNHDCAEYFAECMRVNNDGLEG